MALTDAVGDRRTQNQPGTTDEYPNWRVPLSGPDGAPLRLEEVIASGRRGTVGAVGHRAGRMSFESRTSFRVGDEHVNAYKLLTAVVVPRPIAWVSTLSVGRRRQPRAALVLHGRLRAPADHPVHLGRRQGHAAQRAATPGEFVVSLAHGPLIEAVNNSSAAFDADAERAGAARRSRWSPARRSSRPAWRESPASIECTLHSTLELGDSTVVLGSVVAITVADDVLVDGHPEYDLLDPLARLGQGRVGRARAGHVADRRPRTPDDIA